MVKKLSCYFVTTRISPEKVRKHYYPRNFGELIGTVVLFFFTRVTNKRWLLGTQKVTVQCMEPRYNEPPYSEDPVITNSI